METSIKHSKSNDINMHKILKWLPRSDLWIIFKGTIGTSVVLRTGIKNILWRGKLWSPFSNFYSTRLCQMLWGLLCDNFRYIIVNVLGFTNKFLKKKLSKALINRKLHGISIVGTNSDKISFLFSFVSVILDKYQAFMTHTAFLFFSSHLSSFTMCIFEQFLYSLYHNVNHICINVKGRGKSMSFYGHMYDSSQSTHCRLLRSNMEGKKPTPHYPHPKEDCKVSKSSCKLHGVFNDIEHFVLY